MKKNQDIKTRIIIGIIIISITIIASLLYKNKLNINNYKMQTFNMYDMSLYRLTDHVQNVENFLAKSTISSSSESGAEALTHVWKEADISISYLSQIPLNIEQLNKTAKFLNQVSEYSYTLSRKNIYKEELTQEDLDNLKRLHEYSVELKNGLEEMEEQINLEQVSWDQLQKTDGKNYTKQVDKIDNISFVDIDNNFNEFDGLIYDGAFSEHIHLEEPKGLSEEIVSEKDAEQIAEKLINSGNIKNINKKGKIENGDIEVYQYEIIENNDEITNISISTRRRESCIIK